MLINEVKRSLGVPQMVVMELKVLTEALKQFDLIIKILELEVTVDSLKIQE